MTQTFAAYWEEFSVKLKAGLADEVHVSLAQETAKPCWFQVVVQVPFDSAEGLSSEHETPNWFSWRLSTAQPGLNCEKS
jgi:hypothetical protein